jgi:hypothetical protein
VIAEAPLEVGGAHDSVAVPAVLFLVAVTEVGTPGTPGTARVTVTPTPVPWLLMAWTVSLYGTPGLRLAKVCERAVAATVVDHWPAPFVSVQSRPTRSRRWPRRRRTWVGPTPTWRVPVEVALGRRDARRDAGRPTAARVTVTLAPTPAPWRVDGLDGQLVRDARLRVAKICERAVAATVRRPLAGAFVSVPSRPTR